MRAHCRVVTQLREDRPTQESHAHQAAAVIRCKWDGGSFCGDASSRSDADADPRAMTRPGYLTALLVANLLELALIFWLVPWPWMLVAIVIVAGAAGGLIGTQFPRRNGARVSGRVRCVARPASRRPVARPPGPRRRRS